jgi:enoyl-CoA hydratase/carnithine racemase
VPEPLVLSQIDEQAGVGFIRLNRASKKNALSIALLTELTEHVMTMSGNDALRSIVLEADGDTFSAGRDLHDMREGERRRMRFGDDTGMTMGVVRALRSAPQITIASVQGHCLGGGFVLMSACDLAVIADDAKVGMPEILRGSYGRSATPMLFHSRIPLKHAFLVQLTGRNMSGAEAARMGLASLSVPAAELRERTRVLAAEIASRSPVALEHAKIAAYTEMDLPFDMAAKVDETISQRMRRYTDPLADVDGYLKSQKGGTNLDYKRPAGK